MTLTDHDVYRCLDALAAASAPLPDIALLPGERMALAGCCFRQGSDLVYAVAAALREQPELFADVSIDPAELVARFERGVAFGCLAQLLEQLLRCARDAELLDRGTAVRDALAVLAQARGTARLPFAAAEQQRRLDALALAEQALRRRVGRASARGGASGNRRLSPQARCMAEARRAAARGQGPEGLLPPPRPVPAGESQPAGPPDAAGPGTWTHPAPEPHSPGEPGHLPPCASASDDPWTAGAAGLEQDSEAARAPHARTGGQDHVEARSSKHPGAGPGPGRSGRSRDAGATQGSLGGDAPAPGSGAPAAGGPRGAGGDLHGGPAAAVAGLPAAAAGPARAGCGAAGRDGPGVGGGGGGAAAAGPAAPLPGAGPGRGRAG
ncbi:MAG: hypothetical protein RMK29_15050 [Myxococcales bacterium]|nr:hypothetical protein [Myxococcales bacterium]